MSAEAAPALGFDAELIRHHVEMVHDLAAGIDGVLVLAIYGEHPDAIHVKTAVVMHFGVGNVDGMHEAVMSYDGREHVNVYMPLSVMRKGLERGKKGSEADVVAVLGLVLDHDGDAGRVADPILPPSYVLETSHTPAANRQLFYLFERPLRVEEAKPLAWALRHASGGDTGTLDLSHVWRVPGTLNCPNGRKIHERGRPREPQAVTVASPFRGLVELNAFRAALEPYLGPRPVGAAEEARRPEEINVAAVMDRLPLFLRKAIRAPSEPDADRSAELASVARAMMVRECSDAEIEAVVAAHPNGIGAKYADRTDIAEEVARLRQKFGPRVEPVSPVSPKRLIQSAEQFLSGFKPPDYVVDGIVQRGSLYALTARTGHGKTAVTLYLAQAIARGLAVRGREVQQGSVLILAGENPDDVRARYLVQADKLDYDWRRVPVHFIAGVVNLKDRLTQVRAEAEGIADLGFVIVDTAQAYFPGDEPNNNAQMGEYARLLRELTTLRGRPAVVVNCHPVKSAGRDNLVPYGGGAFLNEVDGNLSLWSDDEAQTTLHWQGKFRGPDFEPMTFRMETALSDTVRDSKGRHLPSVMAQPLGEHELAVGDAARDEDEVRFLTAIGSNKNASFAALARAAGFLNQAGEPLKAKVQRLGHRLKEDRLVEQVRGKFRLTEKGRQEIGLGGNGD